MFNQYLLYLISSLLTLLLSVHSGYFYYMSLVFLTNKIYYKYLNWFLGTYITFSIMLIMSDLLALMSSPRVVQMRAKYWGSLRRPCHQICRRCPTSFFALDSGLG